MDRAAALPVKLTNRVPDNIIKARIRDCQEGEV